MDDRRTAGFFCLLAAGLLASSCGAAAESPPSPGSPRPTDPSGVETVDGARIRRTGGWIFDVDFSPDGKFLAAAGRTGIAVYSVDAFRPVFSAQTESLPTSIDYSGDGQTIAYGTDTGGVRLIRASDGTDLRAMESDDGRINDLAFSPDGRWLAAGRADHSVVLWDTSDGRQARILKGHEFQVDSIAFSPDGKYIAAGSVTASMMDEGAVIIVFDAADGAVVSRMTWQPSPLPVTPPVGVFFLPDGGRVVSISTDGMRMTWDAKTGKQADGVKLDFPGGGNSFGLSEDGMTAAVGAVSGDIFLFAINGDRIRLTEGLLDLSGVECVDFSSDGKQLASGTVDGTLTIWDLEHRR